MDLKQVKAWAREAGQIALDGYSAPEVRRKADHSYVTSADEAIEQLVRARIKQAYPEHGIVGEEDSGFQTEAEYLWALDPIDGTGAFVAGLPVWGISIGLLHHGQPVLGVFYLPALGEWYEAGLDGPARFNGRPIEVMREHLLDSQSYICVPSDVHRRYRIDYPGKVRSLGSMAAYVCLVARGSAAGAVVGRPKLWDIAASMAILERAGGELRLLPSGALLDLGPMLAGAPAPSTVIAGSPAATAMLLERVVRT
jgi:fructose-1,6-bisphosphatase/inositol monophosphatase family enzyme